MRVIVLGGTRFIGRAVVDGLVATGHDVLVCHRGETEPPGRGAAGETAGGGEAGAGGGTVRHLHAERGALPERREELEGFGADALVDCMAMSRRDADLLLAALPGDGLHRVVLSSQDVYRAFATVQAAALATDPVPIDEDAPVRADRYPYSSVPGREEYSKLEVEEVVLGAGATVLRLPMTYGPHDYQRREEWLLRRIRAGRTRIPVGPCNALFPLAFVGDVARGVVGAVELGPRGGTVYNLVAASTDPVAVWARRIAAAAGVTLDLVAVPDGTPLPDDLGITAAVSQALVMSSARARRDLAYTDTEPDGAVAASVAWHLAHPPPDAGGDFARDEAALAAAG